MVCTKCGKPLPMQEGSGRPRKFCSDACKRAATMELRRLNTLIAKLEMRASILRINGASEFANRAEDEIKRMEARLGELVASGCEGKANEEQDI